MRNFVEIFSQEKLMKEAYQNRAPMVYVLHPYAPLLYLLFFHINSPVTRIYRIITLRVKSGCKSTPKRPLPPQPYLTTAPTLLLFSLVMCRHMVEPTYAKACEEPSTHRKDIVDWRDDERCPEHYPWNGNCWTAYDRKQLQKPDRGNEYARWTVHT